ncbi:papain-like cysteine protease family protein [Phenylobacterium sp.]|uniref:papain-like cysteine protease family protein n=1 Tax=Phenylobacterium sp. TaxID=1871053 RepID=UPI00286AD770|nr:papain-like cysteine protease family protein [Phenylobacterium sp.]
MPLTAFPRHTIQAAPAIEAATAAGGGGGGGSHVQLPFRVDPQTQDQWCWAAVSSSVARFFDGNTAWTQCRVASAEFPPTNCCGPAASGPCNRWWFLERALGRTANLRSFTTGPADPALVEGELTGGAPLGIRVQWKDGTGHFLVIAGIDMGMTPPRVTVTDPIFGVSVLPFTALSGQYQQGQGVWTHTYATQG